jgi:hypothetical protein
MEVLKLKTKGLSCEGLYDPKGNMPLGKKLGPKL